MQIYYVTFAGHRKIEHFSDVEEKLEQIIYSMLQENDFVEFYVSNDGDFDIMTVSVIRRVRKRLGEYNSAINLVLSYPIANMDIIEKQFDSVIIPEELQGVHYKKAITAKNRWLIEHSDLLICYVKRNTGGAFNTYKYAKEKKIEILRI